MPVAVIAYSVVVVLAILTKGRIFFPFFYWAKSRAKKAEVCLGWRSERGMAIKWNLSGCFI
ncbi:MAG TPA: hypothetical protein ENN76_02595 [Euryarchaeota archaeon]|nr:hypothetical protein [Euryarchaeota archaeon]